jgi:pimeloyl-ACP methyl ester carboxylesterase
MKKLLLRILLFAPAVFAVVGKIDVQSHSAIAPQNRVILNSCRLPKIDGELRCGSYEVYENRAAGTGRKIALKILVLPALNSQPTPDALFILAGGPGQAATDNAEFFAGTFAAVRRERDIVMIDQRGTGGSNALHCDLATGNGFQKYFGDLFPLDAVRHCREQLELKADLRLYTTPIAMGDLDEVRAALGYERINLFGTSYGTRAALVYLRLYPNHVRSVILKGVVPMNLILPHIIARDAQRSLNLLFADCAADESCHQSFPNLRQEFEVVLRRLDQEAARTSLPAPTTGAVEQVEISRGVFTTVLRSLLQSTSTSSQIPMLVHRAFESDFAPFARLALTLRRGAADSLSYGMFLSVIGSEDIPLTDPRMVARASRDTFLGSYYGRQVMQAAKVWPRGERPRGYNRPVHSKTPVLLISGYLDPATPPNGAAEAARYLPNSLHVIIRNGSHSYSGLSPCVDRIMATFVEKAAVRPLDISCVNEIRRPPFASAPQPDERR